MLVTATVFCKPNLRNVIHKKVRFDGSVEVEISMLIAVESRVLSNSIVSFMLKLKIGESTNENGVVLCKPPCLSKQ